MGPLIELVCVMRFLALRCTGLRDAGRTQVGKCGGALPSCHSGVQTLEEAAWLSACAWWLPWQFFACAFACLFFWTVLLEALPFTAGMRARAKCSGGMPRQHVLHVHI